MTKDSAFILARGIAGGILGGVVGYFVFQWLARQGFYGMMIPGALIGVGAGWAARGRSQALGIMCGVAAVGLAIWAEWQMFPFAKDESLGFMLANLHQKAPLKLIMMALGAVFAYWFGQGR